MASDFACGAIICCPDDDGIVTDFEVFECLYKLSQYFICVANHGLVLIKIGFYIELVGRCYKRSVSKHHGIVEEHGVVFVLLHEVDEEVDKHGFTVFPFADKAAFFGVNVRIPEPFITGWVVSFTAGPHAIVVEADFDHGFGLYSKVVNLPFACDGRLVASIFHDHGYTGVYSPVVMAAASPAWNVPMVYPTMSIWVLSGEE